MPSKSAFLHSTDALYVIPSSDTIKSMDLMRDHGDVCIAQMPLSEVEPSERQPIRQPKSGIPPKRTRSSERRSNTSMTFASHDAYSSSLRFPTCLPRRTIRNTRQRSTISKYASKISGVMYPWRFKDSLFLPSLSVRFGFASKPYHLRVLFHFFRLSLYRSWSAGYVLCCPISHLYRKWRHSFTLSST